MTAESDRIRSRTGGKSPRWGGAGLIGIAVLAVLATVGVPAAAAVGVLLALDQYWGGRRHVLADAAIAGLCLLPVVWFLGSSEPLFPPAPRIQDNPFAHQLGGAVLWLMALAVLTDLRRSEERVSA